MNKTKHTILWAVENMPLLIFLAIAVMYPTQKWAELVVTAVITIITITTLVVYFSKEVLVRVISRLESQTRINLFIDILFDSAMVSILFFGKWYFFLFLYITTIVISYRVAYLIKVIKKIKKDTLKTENPPVK